MTRGRDSAGGLVGSSTDTGFVDIGTAAVSWPPWPRELPGTRCRFDLAPPRNFLYPAVLLILAERPTHGYRIWEALSELGFGVLDRPGVYRVLADLERDGLIDRLPGTLEVGGTEQRRGLGRQVYQSTPAGRTCLQAWMAVVAAEREALDLVLRRYWRASALPSPLPVPETGRGASHHELLPTDQAHVEGAAGQARAAQEGAPSVGPAAGAGPTVARLYRVAPDRSSLTVAARSNLGPIAFISTSLSGWLAAAVAGGTVVAEPPPTAELRIPVASLSSGNRLYDRELHRRVDARRYPEVEVRLEAAVRLGAGNCFLVTGRVAMHGREVLLEGVVRTGVVLASTRRAQSADMNDHRLVVSGEHVVDVRSFGMATPAMGPLRLDPDVQLSLHLEVDVADQD
jgi:DNA-binding PadR family transcriptional regulator